MTNLAIYTAVSAWASWSGSHMQRTHWGEFPWYVKAGIKGAVYILWPNSPFQFEDLRRLRQDAGFTRLVLRLGWPRYEALPSPADFIAKFRAEVVHARSVGYAGLWVMAANEPNIELVEFDDDGRVARVIMTAEAFLAWYQEFMRLWEADAELRLVPLVPPTVAGYAPNSIAWLERAIGPLQASSPIANAHLYPKTRDELAGEWSLPWWKARLPGKRWLITEMGCRTKTPADARNALLPELWRQVRHDPGVLFAAAFVQWTEGAEHAEHWLTSAQAATYWQIAGETTAPQPTPEPAPTPTPGVDVAALTNVMHGLWAVQQRLIAIKDRELHEALAEQHRLIAEYRRLVGLA